LIGLVLDLEVVVFLATLGFLDLYFARRLVERSLENGHHEICIKVSEFLEKYRHSILFDQVIDFLLNGIKLLHFCLSIIKI
jgi:hypothetical protein